MNELEYRQEDEVAEMVNVELESGTELLDPESYPRTIEVSRDNEEDVSYDRKEVWMGVELEPDVLDQIRDTEEPVKAYNQDHVDQLYRDVNESAV